MSDQDKLMIRKFLKEISDNIPDSELTSLIYICRVDRADEEKITKAFQVFNILEKRGDDCNMKYVEIEMLLI